MAHRKRIIANFFVLEVKNIILNSNQYRCCTIEPEDLRKNIGWKYQYFFKFGSKVIIDQLVAKTTNTIGDYYKVLFNNNSLPWNGDKILGHIV